MREPYSLGAVSSTGSLRILDVQVSSSHSNRSLRSVMSTSTRVGHLLKQALTYLETDRKAAWRCVSDASTLLGADVEDPEVSAPSSKNIRSGGLANWQATRILAYIEANLGSKIEIGGLANLLTLSRSHFSRAFKRSFGLAPMEYITVRRVELAKAMISSTREPLADVALACGFADQPHLNRRFRDLIGMTPGRWRRSNMPVPTLAPMSPTSVR